MKVIDSRKMIRPLVLLVTALIALFAIFNLWNYYNSVPWTRDARVRGDVMKISSDIAGLVTEVLVQDNETVKKGQVLFKVDLARQELAVEQAKSEIAKYTSSLAASEANLAAAEASVKKSHVTAEFAERTAERYSKFNDGSISKQEQDLANTSVEQEHAEHRQLEAAVEQAKANIIEQKALIKAATSQLHLAELNRHRAEVVAPEDGTLSNFELRVGNYVQVGQSVAGILDRKKLYVVGYFEETKLNRIQVGDAVTVRLMGDTQTIKGHVQGIAPGIEDRERSSTSGVLANVNPTFNWVRLAQRVPVRIILDEQPHNELAFVAGRTATVHVITKHKD